jgi:hypothetical protein
MGGEGFACPAETCNLMFATTFFAILFLTPDLYFSGLNT